MSPRVAPVSMALAALLGCTQPEPKQAQPAKQAEPEQAKADEQAKPEAGLGLEALPPQAETEPPPPSELLDIGPSSAEDLDQRRLAVLALVGSGKAAKLPLVASDPGAAFGRSHYDNMVNRPTLNLEPTPSIHLHADMEVGEGLDPSVVQRVVRRNLNQLRYCYQLRVDEDPKLAGSLSLNITVDAEGTVSKASISSTELNDERLQTCMTKAATRWKFPKPASAPVEISCPMQLEIQ